jgi:osmotically-inducible protein OsmY
VSPSTAILQPSQALIPSGLANEPARSPRAREGNEHLIAQVKHALCATGYATLRAVTVTLRDQALVLQGQVFSYYLKQIAQETALSVPGVDELHNEILVV